jgi:hypothetical protein
MLVAQPGLLELLKWLGLVVRSGPEVVLLLQTAEMRAVLLAVLLLQASAADMDGDL